MKKIITALILMVMILLMATVAIAEGELPAEPFTWEYLATIAGATVATLLIVQLLKLPLDHIWKIPTRIVAYIFALIILEVATYFTVGIDLNKGILAAVNAVIVALAAMGGYEMTFRKADAAKQAQTMYTENN